MRWGTVDARDQRGIDERMVEQTELKLHTQHSAHRPVKILSAQPAIVQTLEQRALEDVMREVIELHVHTGANRHARCIGGGCCHMVRRVQALNRSEIREDESLESPLLAQDLLQELRGG